MRVALMAFIVMLVQVSHPWLHLHEVIDPSADAQLACPMSHVAGELPILLPWLVLARLMGSSVLKPHLWLGRLVFIHRLAPRAPPRLSQEQPV
jgi:hypothetical protein